MKEGRDLRNKAVYYKDCLYSIGGNDYTAERFNFLKNEWNPLPSYGTFLHDNLDSWSCAVSY